MTAMASGNGDGNGGGNREEGSHLSIGEVLARLQAEFPDVTISKIRFLESQGLISPERTASGYRKFYDEDVELLRVILTEQRENYLPLRVIKDRLDSGEIDPTGEHLRPNGHDAHDGQEAGAYEPGDPAGRGHDRGQDHNLDTDHDIDHDIDQSFWVIAFGLSITTHQLIFRFDLMVH